MMPDYEPAEAEFTAITQDVAKIGTCSHTGELLSFDAEEGAALARYIARRIHASVLAEREACAAICRSVVDQTDCVRGYDNNPYAEGTSYGAQTCEDAIRSRSEPNEEKS